MREAHRHWLWKYLGIVLSNSLRILAVLKWCLIETWTVQPFCCHKHLISKIKKVKKKLHFYLLLELGTLFCNMCCNSEDMWVLEAWCHMTATFWGNHPFAAPAIMWPISAARRRLTSNIVPAHTRVSAEQRVCVSVQKRIGESQRRAWGKVFVKRHLFINGVLLLSEQGLYSGIDRHLWRDWWCICVRN